MIYKLVSFLATFLVADTFAQNHVYSTSGSFADKSQVNLDQAALELKSKLSPAEPIQYTILGFTTEGADVLVATLPGFEKNCHVHPSDARLRLISGEFFFQTSSLREKVIVGPNDEFLVPKGTPHIEGTSGTTPAVFITAWNPLPDLDNNTIFVEDILCAPETLPQEPTFETCKRNDGYTLPESWTATVLLHPFAPPPQSGPALPFIDSTPFFQLSVADLFVNSTFFEAHLRGCDLGYSWWYRMQCDDPHTVWVSHDMGRTWKQNDGVSGWNFPSRNWLSNAMTCSGSAPLNWALNQDLVDWVKDPYQGSSTWFWFDSETGFPKRVMYGRAPPTPVLGNPEKQNGAIPLLQMFSFSYFANFTEGPLPSIPLQTKPFIDGFSCGNVGGLPLLQWDSALSFSAFMVPVDSKSEPLPTTVLYNWATPPRRYNAYSRVQVTQMSYKYNPDSPLLTETAVLFGTDTENELTGTGWLIDRNKDATINGKPICVFGEFIGQQPPNWPVLGNGEIKANIQPLTSLVGDTGRPVTVNSVVFPPVPPYYSDGTYLWTWYAVGNNEQARPITFMQSASTIGEGTSLALADYYGFADWNQIGKSTDPINTVMGRFLSERVLGIVRDQDCSFVPGERPNLSDILSHHKEKFEQSFCM